MIARKLHIFQITHRTLAAQLCGIFVTVEKDEFESRLTQVLPLLLKQFHANFSASDNTKPGAYVKLNNAKLTRTKFSNLKNPEKIKDHHLFQVLQLLLKISGYCSLFLTSKKYEDSVSSCAGELFSLKRILFLSTKILYFYILFQNIVSLC